MFFKIKLFVICAVILNFSECKDCEDLFNCVANWVAAALSPNSNLTIKIIENVAANDTPTKSLDGDLLKYLTHYVVEKFSNLIREGPELTVLENKTKVYVQSLKINEYNVTNTIQPMTKITDGKTEKGTMKKSDKNKHNITSYIHTYINQQEETVTSLSLNTYDIPKTNDVFDLTTEEISVTETTTMKTHVIENIANGTSSLRKMSNNPVPDLSKDHRINIIRDFYSDDDFIGDNEIDIDELIPDNLTDYLDIDYTDIYKDTTNEDVEYTPATYIPTTTAAVNVFVDKKPIDGLEAVYPWIATVFIMNGESKQFEYICDGSLLSERVVLTAARCVMKDDVTVDVANILIILGKRSLQATGPNEVVLRVRSIEVHENFVSTEGKINNDLAIVTLEEPVQFNDDVQPALIGVGDESSPKSTATTGWHVSGPLQPLYLEPQSTEHCLAKTNSKNYLCATLGDSETTCPSYGGLLVDRQDDNQWRLQGIASGTPMSEGVCFNKHLTFTKIGNYLDWVMKSVKDASK